MGTCRVVVAVVTEAGGVGNGDPDHWDCPPSPLLLPLLLAHATGHLQGLYELLGGRSNRS